MPDQPNDELSHFASHLHSEVVTIARGLGDDLDHSADGTPSARFLEDAFTEWSINILSDVGAIDDGHVSYFNKKFRNTIAKVNGYSVMESDDDVRIDLFVSAFRGDGVLYTLASGDVKQVFDRACEFLKQAGDGLHLRMERSDPAWDMAQRIHEARASGNLSRCQIILLSDGLAPRSLQYKRPIRNGDPARFDLRTEVWDLERLHRSASSGRAREVIEIDFLQEFDERIPCLPVSAGEGDYGAYLAVFPAHVLHRLYDEYGERLLELNVRSFLQARGKVNKGIRDTILKTPHLFFAFNNGITAVAEGVLIEQMDDGRPAIRSVRGLQIVNGGQTTASIHRAAKKDRAELSKVSVQMKLSEVKEELMNDLVPRISLFANSQNKVSEADFSANDPFHLEIEELSRTIWTPGGTTRWFYERARGQFQVARTNEGRNTTAFDAKNPKSQVFTKTDLAYFEHSWAQLPHHVSKGAQKNFKEFTLALKKRLKTVTVDDRYFKRLVAQAIIFRETQRRAREACISAYRANVVTYTVAYLAHKAGDRINLDEIWTRQSVGDPVRRAIDGLLEPIEAAIKESAGGQNVTEWCKKELCWHYVRSLDLPIPLELRGTAA